MPQTLPAPAEGGSARPKKRKARDQSPEPRARKQQSRSHSQDRVKAADRATDAALKRLFVAEEVDSCSAELDQVLACAYDEDILRSALQLASTRMNKWTKDKSEEYGDGARRRHINASLMKRMAMRLLPHMLESSEDGSESFPHSLAVSGTTQHYKLELTISPILEITDSDDDSREDDSLDGEDEASIHDSSDAETYTPPSIVSAAFQGRSAEDHPNSNASRATMQYSTPPGSNSPIDLPASNNIASDIVHHTSVERFPTYDSSEALLLLRLPSHVKRPLSDSVLKEDVDSATQAGIQGKVASRNFLGCEMHYRMNRMWVARFQNQSAANRAYGAAIPFKGTHFTFEPYSRRMSTTFVCKRIPKRLTGPDTTHVVSILLHDQQYRIKFAKRNKKTWTAVVHVQEPTDMWSFSASLRSNSGTGVRGEVRFNVWLDGRHCALCKSLNHQTFSCSQLVNSIG